MRARCRRSVLPLAVALAVLAVLALPLRALPSDEIDSDLQLARERVYPALVNIAVVGQSFEGGRARKFPAAGSGVVVTADGHVLTNYHVAGETTRITCRLPDGRRFEARVVVHDPLTDLSVLRLALAEGETVPCAELGDSDLLDVGDRVLAMGNPQTLSSSMTLGIVSHPRRVFTSFTGAEIEERDLGDGQTTGLFTRWIQHDALILGGNSGGPLVDLAGRVVGINELGGNGVGFAIPSNLARDVLEQALAHGEVRRGWFGLTVLPVDKLGREDGALVSWVVGGGPAERAGLRAGDVVTSVGGAPVAVRDFEEVPAFYERISHHLAGEQVEIHYLREGAAAVAAVAVDPLGAALDDQEEFRTWGITVRGITRPMALSRRYPDTHGVLVTGVRPGRAAAEADPPLERGDVIVELGGSPVTDRAAFRALWESCGGSAVLRVRRGEGELIAVLESAGARDDGFQSTELPKAWIGVETQVITPAIAAALGATDVRGFRITRVIADTEAARAGLEVGDLVTAIDGRALKASRSQDAPLFARQVETLTIGAEASLTVRRGGEERELAVRLEPTPEGASRARKGEDDTFEFEYREIAPQDRHRERWDADAKGAIVTAVTNGGWASIAGLAVLDRIISVDDVAIDGVDGLAAALATARERRAERVRLFVSRGHRTTYLFIEPDWSAEKR